MREGELDMRGSISRNIIDAGLLPANWGIGSTFSVIFQRPNCDSQTVVIGTIDGMEFEIDGDEMSIKIITKALTPYTLRNKRQPVLSYSAGKWNLFDFGETINNGKVIPCKVSCPPLMS